MVVPAFSRRNPDLEPLLTFKEAMARLRVGRSTIYRMMQAGTLRGYKVGATWRFMQADVEQVIVPAEMR